MTGAAPHGRRVLVTGASRGIGRAIAERLLRDGAIVAAVGRDAATLPGLPIEADLGRAGEGERIVERALELLGGIDDVVSCAGVARHADVGAVSREALAEQLAVNFVEPFFLLQAAAARMTGGAIVTVASTLGMQPAPGTAAYAASKAALLSMTRSLAQELAARGIRVNAVAPGVVETDMVAPERRDELRRLHPIGRLGTPEDVAEAVIYLLGATWVTGTILTVDGGLLTR